MVISLVKSSGYIIFDRGICNQRVGGSNPSVGSINKEGAFPEKSPFLCRYGFLQIDGYPFLRFNQGGN